MLHYTCDLCGRSIEGQRFSVSIQIQRHDPPHPPLIADDDLDLLGMIEEEIELMDSTSQFQLPEPSRKTFERDLCPSCARRYERDPLSRERTGRLNSSSN